MAEEEAGGSRPDHSSFECCIDELEEEEEEYQVYNPGGEDMQNVWDCEGKKFVYNLEVRDASEFNQVIVFVKSVQQAVALDKQFKDVELDKLSQFILDECDKC